MDEGPGWPTAIADGSAAAVQLLSGARDQPAPGPAAKAYSPPGPVVVMVPGPGQQYAAFRYPPHHRMQPVRMDIVHKLLAAMQLIQPFQAGASTAAPPPATAHGEAATSVAPATSAEQVAGPSAESVQELNPGSTAYREAEPGGSIPVVSGSAGTTRNTLPTAVPQAIDTSRWGVEQIAAFKIGRGATVHSATYLQYLEGTNQSSWLSGAAARYTPPAPGHTSHDFDSKNFIKYMERSNLADEGGALSVKAASVVQSAATGPDSPTFCGLWEFCQLYSAGSVQAAEALHSGRCMTAIHWGGGLHHARFNKAAGGCYLNDLVMAVARFQQLGWKRILYVDVDVHHGDGVEELLAQQADISVITLSAHMHGVPYPPGFRITPTAAAAADGSSKQQPDRAPECPLPEAGLASTACACGVKSCVIKSGLPTATFCGRVFRAGHEPGARHALCCCPAWATAPLNKRVDPAASAPRGSGSRAAAGGALGVYPGDTGCAANRLPPNAVNLPLRVGCGGAAYLAVLQPVLLAAVERLQPQAVVLCCGVDALAHDPQGSLNLSVRDLGAVVRAVAELRLPLLVTGAGGYSVSDVAKAWTFLTAVLLGREGEVAGRAGEHSGADGTPHQLPQDANHVLTQEERDHFCSGKAGAAPDWCWHLDRTNSDRPDTNRAPYLDALLQHSLARLAAMRITRSATPSHPTTAPPCDERLAQKGRRAAGGRAAQPAAPLVPGPARGVAKGAASGSGEQHEAAQVPKARVAAGKQKAATAEPPPAAKRRSLRGHDGAGEATPAAPAIISVRPRRRLG